MRASFPWKSLGLKTEVICQNVNKIYDIISKTETLKSIMMGRSLNAKIFGANSRTRSIVWPGLAVYVLSVGVIRHPLRNTIGDTELRLGRDSKIRAVKSSSNAINMI